MKKILSLLLLLLSFSSLALAQDKIEIVSTLPDFKNFAEIIGGDLVHVVSIAHGNNDPHHVEIKPSDILRLKKADLLLVNGLELDSWIQPLILNSRNSKINPGSAGYLDLSEGVQVLEIPKFKVDRSMGDLHTQGNPHYSLSPRVMRLVFLRIEKKLSEIDPAHTEFFHANAEAYLKLLDKKIIEWKILTQKLQDRRIVTFHSSWAYFFQEFGLESAGFMEPKPGVSPSPAYTAELIEKIKKEKIKIIFKEEYFSDSVPNFIAEKTGAKVISVPTLVGGSKTADSYIGLIDTLIQKLIENS